MLPPAAEAAAAAAAICDRPTVSAGAAFLGDDDELDDSEDDEEEVETDELEDEDVDDDEDDLDRKPPAPSAVVPAAVSVGVLNGSSSPSTSSASYLAAAAAPKIPNPNGNPAPVMRKSNPIPSLNGAVGADGAVQGVVVAGGEGALDGPDRKRQRTDPRPAPPAGGSAVAVAVEEKKPLAALEDSRRLFQRLFTDEDEITILQGFLDFNTQRSGAGANHAHHHDTGPFYDQIRTRLQLDFNKNQLVEKLRRLKKKFRNIMSKMSTGKDYAFKSPHDQATFELSRKIWGSSIYSRGGGAGPDDDDDDDPTPHPQMGGDDQGTLMGNSDRRRMRRRGRRRSIAAAAAAASEALLMTPEAPVEVKVAESHMPSAIASVPNVIEETVRSCLSPLFKELLFCAAGGPVGPGANSGGLGGLGLSPFPLTVGNNPVNLPNAATIDDKWRKQQILELEVYSKRIDLVQEHIKLMLEELRK